MVKCKVCGYKLVCRRVLISQPVVVDKAIKGVRWKPDAYIYCISCSNPDCDSTDIISDEVKGILDINFGRWRVSGNSINK